jgi:SAM-dependent methyltransferase
MPVIDQPRTFRTSFDQVAADYDAVRPGYPTALVNDLIDFARLPPDGRILEIGCGTGRATMPFARRGYPMVCLDIGSELAALARVNCQAYPNVQIHVTSFEDWHAEPHMFDLVFSATAFHWIASEIAYPKAAQVLRETGALAVFSNEHPPTGEGFFADVQTIYQQLLPDALHDPGSIPAIQSKIEQTCATIDATGLFAPVIVKTYPWTTTYTTANYLRLLNTYSPNRNLGPEKRTQLFQRIADLIDSKYGGTITKPYLSVLYLTNPSKARRSPPPA